MGLRRAVTLLCILMFGVLVQASAVCHVVTCSLPDNPPKCHHETPETPSPETCKEFAAAAGSISLDIALPSIGDIQPAPRFEIVSQDRAEFIALSPSAYFTVLRI